MRTHKCWCRTFRLRSCPDLMANPSTADWIWATSACSEIWPARESERVTILGQAPRRGKDIIESLANDYSDCNRKMLFTMAGKKGLERRSQRMLQPACVGCLFSGECYVETTHSHKTKAGQPYIRYCMRSGGNKSTRNESKARNFSAQRRTEQALSNAKPESNQTRQAR